MALFSDVLLTVDYDRTLTALDSSLPQRNLDAIEFFTRNGGAFTMNTGRSVPMSMGHIVPRVPTNAPLLLYNGSAAYDVTTGLLEQVHPIDVDPKAFLEDLIAHFPQLIMEIQSPVGHHLVRKNAGWEAYCENNHCAHSYVTLDSIPEPFIKVAINGEFREPTVASMYDATQEDLEVFSRLTAFMEEHYGDKIAAFRACPRILDLHAKGCSKLEAARQLQQRLGRKILVCVGDSLNDLTMLEGADYAYCPSDSAISHLFENVGPCGYGAVADVIYEKIPALLKNKP